MTLRLTPTSFVTTAKEREGMAAKRKGAPLSAGFVRSVTRPGRYGDGYGGKGLALRVQVGKYGSVSRSWTQRIRVGGRWTNLGLGAFPEVSLREARIRAEKNWSEAKEGRDPRTSVREVVTFSVATENVIALRRPTWKSTSRAESQWRSMVTRYAYPTIGDMPVDRITTADCLAILTPLWQYQPPTAKMLRTRISQTMDWCVAQGLRGDNPAGPALVAALPKQGNGVRNHRALPHAEVRDALVKIAESTAHDRTKRLARFVALTATRSGEARGADWSEISGDTWTIPADRMKAGREHRVPLSPQALEVLGSRGEGPVFGKVGDSTLMALFRRLDIGTVHGLRSSFRSWCQDSAVDREVAEACLAHRVGNQAEQAYSRSDLLDRRREVMARWASYIT